MMKTKKNECDGRNEEKKLTVGLHFNSFSRRIGGILFKILHFFHFISN